MTGILVQTVFVMLCATWQTYATLDYNRNNILYSAQTIQTYDCEATNTDSLR